MFFSTLTFSATVWHCSNATLLVTVQLLALLHFSCFCLLVSSCRDFKLRSVQFFSFTLGQHFWSVVYTNDSISWTGGIHQVETSDLRQACPVKRVCWILLGTPFISKCSCMKPCFWSFVGQTFKELVRFFLVLCHTHSPFGFWRPTVLLPSLGIVTLLLLFSCLVLTEQMLARSLAALRPWTICQKAATVHAVKHNLQDIATKMCYPLKELCPLNISHPHLLLALPPLPTHYMSSL